MVVFCYYHFLAYRAFPTTSKNEHGIAARNIYSDNQIYNNGNYMNWYHKVPVFCNYNAMLD